MTTAIDTNVIVTFLDSSQALDQSIDNAINAAYTTSDLVISGPVYAELLALPGRVEPVLDRFLDDTGIRVEWELPEAAWRLAGKAHHAYTLRRRSHRAPAPRRILTDFLIGAYALVNGYTLLTLDQRNYRAAFPKLKIQKV